MQCESHVMNKALQELGIQSSRNDYDLQELSYLLFDILNYPSVEAAEQHHRASNIGTNDLFTHKQKINEDIKNRRVANLQACQCCGLLVNNYELPYSIDFEELNIGVGVLLFFRNYLSNCLLFFLMFMLYSVYAIVTNFNLFSLLNISAICILPGSSCGVVNIGAGSKILFPDMQKNRLNLVQSIIAAFFVVIWGTLNLVKRHLQLKMEIEMEVKRISAPDFTLMMTHCPQIYLDKSFKQNLANLNQIFKAYQTTVESKYSYEVIKINVARPLYVQSRIQKRQVEQLEHKLEKKLEGFRGWVKHRQNHKRFPIRRNQRNQKYEDYIKFFSKEFDALSTRRVALNNDNLVFITLRYSKAMQEIVKSNQPSSWSNLWNICSPNSCFPIKRVNIRKAPEPEEIKWENIGFSYSSKIMRKLLIWLVTVGLIGVSLGISIGIAYVDKQSLSSGISIGISLVITVINVGIQIAIMNLSYLENDYTSSSEQSNAVLKIGIGQLINSIGVPIVITILANNDPSVPDKTWLKEGGLVDDVFYIALLNILVPIGRFIDPYEIFLKMKRCYYSRPSSRLKLHGQKSLNNHYGNHTFDIGYEYAYLIKTSIFTAFFACMQPIIVLFAPCGLFLYYLADKRNLLRHLQRPNYHSSGINQTVDLILLLSPIAFGFGHLLVNNFTNEEEANGTLLINWIIVIVAAIFAVMAFFQIFYKCIKKPQYPNWDYLQAKPLIPTDYDRENPVSSRWAINEFQHYLKELQKKQQLPDCENMIKSSNMLNSNMHGLGPQGSLYKLNAKVPVYNTNLSKYRVYMLNNENSIDSAQKLGQGSL